ncbi:hypothetical protein ACWEOH_02650 [Agromyces sp. NPDC004153]
MIVVEVCLRNRLGMAITAALVIGTYIVTTLAIIAAVAPPSDPMVSINAQRFLIVVPLFLCAGALAVRSQHWPIYTSMLVLVASTAALFAVAESLLGYSILGQHELFARSQREGAARAVVASENVLVFGTMLAATVPFVPAAPLRGRLIWTIALVAGAWATGSRGASLVATVVAIVQLLPRGIDVVQRSRRAVGLMTASVISVLLVLALLVWEPVAYGASGSDYSSSYRTAAYALLPEILRVEPFGYGFSSIPFGTWLLLSESRGVRDLAVTVDSELIYAALTFGIAGIALFLVALWISVRAIRWDYTVGVSGVIIAVCGLVLALHAWDTLGPYWYLMIGGGAALIRAGRGRRHDIGKGSLVAEGKVWR